MSLTTRPHKQKLCQILCVTGATIGLLTIFSDIFVTADLTADTFATNLQSEITAEINGTHYITLSAPDVAFSITPDTNDSGTTIGLDTTQVDVSVETNAIGGAELYLSTSNSTNALYKDGNVNNSNLPSINASSATISNPTTLNNLSTNTWGYSLDNTNYSGVPTIESPNHIASIDGVNTGTISSDIISATIPIYYAAKVDTSIPSGSYANSVTYLAVVDGGIVTSAKLTSITVDGDTVEQLQLDKTNTILVTTNLKTNTYGVPRVYYTTTDPAGYSECTNVVVSSNTDGYMTIQCETAPTTVATGLTLHIVPKGTPSSTNPSEMTGDPFCSDGTYQANTSQCEAGEWKWGSFTVSLPNIKAPVFNGIKTMQEMTPEICAAAQENDTTRLEDARDGKMYWVAKLKDGNCWMTQNLDFDLELGKSLTSEDSDVSSSWSPRTTTFTAASEKTTGFFPVQSWNLGDVVWKDPDNSNSCVSSDDLYNSSCSPYWQNVSSGWTPMTEYRTDGIVYDVNTQTYDAHYLVGNYYSWQATTAGTGGLDVSQYDEASGSICPAGWRLPYSGPSNNSRPGSFYGLLNQYDLNFSSGDNNIAKAPLFFVYAGQVDPSRGYLFNAGNVVSYWSSVVYSSGNVYLLDINPNYINPSSNYGRNDGFSVRCVAPSA